MPMSERACSDISNAYNEITKGTPSLTSKTDACETG